MRFFHIAEQQGKQFLASPDGEPFFMRGANHYGDGSYLPLMRQERYSDVAAWRQSVVDRHRAWGFNYLPPSIGPSDVSREAIPPKRNHNGKTLPQGESYRTPEWSAQHFSEAGIPFTVLLSFPKQYMAGDNMPDVFSKAFRQDIDRHCRAVCTALKDNPNLIGYHFCHNPPWHPHADAFFDWVHQIVIDGNPAQQQWARLMRQIYGSVDRWRGTYTTPIESFDEIASMRFPLDGKISATKMRRDKIAFMQRVCAEWYTVYSETIRTYDPEHLLLGDRNTLHLQPLSDWALQIMSRHIDVLSVNVMGPMQVVLDELEQVTRHWDGPIHLADTGAGIYNGHFPKSAYMCRDSDEFGSVYHDYMRLGVEHPQIIGLGWCGYYETCCARSGLVDSVTDEPDAEKIATIKQANTWMDQHYPVACGMEPASI